MNISFILVSALSITATALKLQRVPPEKEGGINLARTRESDEVELDMNDIHKTYLDLGRTQGTFITHKTLDSTFKIGREGSNKCLSFLHIPKNAGTALEDHMNKFVLSAQDSSVRHWGRHDTTLNCTHENSNGKQCFFKYKNSNGYERRTSCYKWHVPPYLDQKLADSYTADGCETFCVVRSPSEKFFSQLVYDGRSNLGANCDMEHFHNAAEYNIRQTEDNPYFYTCHFVPQTEFIYGDSDKPKYCTHMLRHEHLKADFSMLMEKFDIPVKLVRTPIRPQTRPISAAHISTQTQTQGCKIPLEQRDADKTVHDFITTYYKKDLENFHYDL